MDTDLDLSVTADNTSVTFDWIVKSENAPHEVQFELNDGGIPIVYKGIDANKQAIEVKTQIDGNKVIESIDKGGKYPKIINPDFRVNAWNRDAEMYWNGSSWNWSNTLSNPMAGYYGSTIYKYGMGMCWTNTGIMPGANITNAYIILRCYVPNDIGTVNTKITGYTRPAPYAFSSITDYQNKRGTVVGGANNDYVTSHQVNWDNIGAWSANGGYQSQSITSVVQDIVNSSYWTDPYAMTLFWDDHDGRSSTTNYAVRSAYSYNGSPSYAPLLHVDYNTNPPSTPTYVFATDGYFNNKIRISWFDSYWRSQHI